MENMPTRETLLDDLYKANYGTLYSLIYDLHPKMLFGSADAILGLLADALTKYRGELVQQAFYQWASRFIKRKARQFVAAERIMKTHSSTIFYAIRDNMDCFARDAAVDYDDVKQEVHLLILRYALSLSKTGTASLRNRLNKLIKRHCWGYHIRKRKNRLRIITEFKTTLAREGAEILTPAEIASQRWDDGEPDYCYAPIAA